MEKEILSFANHHPFIFFLILLFVVLPLVISVIVGPVAIMGDVLQSFFAIFKKRKTK